MQLRIDRLTSYSPMGGCSNRLIRDLNTLQDIAEASTTRAIHACAVENISFVGWHAQWYEFFKAGLDVNKIFTSIEFVHSYDSVAEAVDSGNCDVGFMRTGMLELLALEEEFKIETFHVINPRSHVGYTEMTSTDLYPERPFSALPHVPEEIRDVVAIPLLATEATSFAAVVGKHAGFTSVLDYSSISAVRYNLSLEKNGSCGVGSYRDLTKELQPCLPCPAGASSPSGAQIAVIVVALVAFLFCFVLFALLVAYKDNKTMKASSSSFNMVISLACAVVSASVVLFASEPAPDNWVCALRWWLPCIAASTVFGTLFSKTYRLHVIFRIYETKQKIPRAIKFGDAKVATMVFGFVLSTATVLTIFFAVDPPFYLQRKLQMKNQPYLTYVNTCEISKVLVPLVFILYAFLLIFQSVLAYRVCIMVDSILDFYQKVHMIIRGGALVIGACTPVAVLYIPKLNAIWKHNENIS
eukprot:g66295.t1